MYVVVLSKVVAAKTLFGNGVGSHEGCHTPLHYISCILWTLEFHYHIHNSPPPVPTLAKSIHFSAHHTFDRRSLFPSWSG